MSIATLAGEFAELPLQQFFNEHYLLERTLCLSSRQNMYLTIDAFEAFLGVAPTMNDLTDRTLNRFLLAQGDRGLSASTVKQRRACLLALWNAAWTAETPMVPLPPRRVRRITPPHQIIDCWDKEEIAKLLEAARKLPGAFRYTRVKRGGYWFAIIAAAYDTGLRRGDLFDIRFEDIRPDGKIALVQHKTDKPHLVGMRPETIAAVRAIQWPARPLIFGDVIKAKKQFSHEFRALVKSVGIKPGTFRWLRRASGTHMELMLPGSGHRQLGNRRDVFERHYAATWLIDAGRPLPPALPVLTGDQAPVAPNEPDSDAMPIGLLAEAFIATALPASYQANGKCYLGAIFAAGPVNTVGDLHAASIMAFIIGLKVKEGTRRDYRQCAIRFLSWLVDRGIHGAAAECLSVLVAGGPPKR